MGRRNGRIGIGTICWWGLRAWLFVASANHGLRAESWNAPGTLDSGGEEIVSVRAYVWVPREWTLAVGLLAESVSLSLDHPVDGAIVQVNGREIGRTASDVLSSDAPRRSARDETHRWKIPPGTLVADQFNCVTITFRGFDGRVGCLGAAPILAGYHDECSLEGAWQVLRGRTWTSDAMQSVLVRPASSVFERIQPATSALSRPERLTPGRHLTPTESLRAMKVSNDLVVEQILAEPDVAQPVSLDFDAQGRLWVVEYRQYPFPAGLQMVSRDKFYRAVYDRLPAAPPHHSPGADRISIHADLDGDGTWETHRIFLDRLNIVSSIELVPDGVWVLNPPYLLFYRDQNHDDQPDGDPEVHLMGFGLEDTHSIANSLTLGPDGWLYGAQGSTTSSRIQVVGTDQPAVYRDGAMIWRYEPRSRRYEIFAEGGGNAFGLDIDAEGNLFAGHNGGNTRGFHSMPGAYYQKGTDDKYGPLSNPFVFAPLGPMGHMPSPRFSHDLLRYEASTLPERFRGQLLSIDPLQQQAILATLKPSGSTFTSTDVEPVLSTNDLAFRPIDITLGVDGCVYVADFCEEFIAHGQHYQGQIDPATGRVYRLRNARSTETAFSSEIASIGAHASPADWLAGLTSSNRAIRRWAAQRLATHADRDVVAKLRDHLATADQRLSLEALWILHRANAMDAEMWQIALVHPEAAVRRWAVRLLGERVEWTGVEVAQATEKISRETDVSVRAQWACSAQRWPFEVAWPIMQRLAAFDRDHEDPHLPALLWWAFEHHLSDRQDVVTVSASKGDRASLEVANARANLDAPSESNETRMLNWLAEQATWDSRLVRQTLAPFLLRRWAMGNHADLLRAARMLSLAPDDEGRALLVAAFEQAFQHRSLSEVPEELAAALQQAGGGSEMLRARLGDVAAREAVLKTLADPARPVARRLEAARVCADLESSLVLDTLERVVQTTDDPVLLAALLNAIPTDPESRVARYLLSELANWPDETQRVALRWLVSHRGSADLVLSYWEFNDAARQKVTPELVEQLRWLRDPAIRARVAQLWPEREGDDQERAAIERARVLEALQTGHADPYQGRLLFQQHCGKCHTLFREGGNIGPNLTAYARHDVERLVWQIVQPSAEIREGYEMWIASCSDGRVVSGFLVDQDKGHWILRTVDGENQRVVREQVETFERARASLMPGGLTHGLEPQPLRDLFAFLRLSQPLNER